MGREAGRETVGMEDEREGVDLGDGVEMGAEGSVDSSPDVVKGVKSRYSG